MNAKYFGATPLGERRISMVLRCAHADPEHARSIFTALLGRLSGPPPDAEPTLHVPRPRPPAGGPALALVDSPDGPASNSDVESSCKKILPN